MYEKKQSPIKKKRENWFLDIFQSVLFKVNSSIK